MQNNALNFECIYEIEGNKGFKDDLQSTSVKPKCHPLEGLG